MIEEALVKKSSSYGLAVIFVGIALAIPPAGAAERAARAPSVVPPQEVIAIVRSVGLSPIGKPTRKGTNYLLRARDEDGIEVRVVVDGRAGEVTAVTPVGYNNRELDPMRPSIYDSGPPVYEPAPIYRRDVPIIEEQNEPPIYRRAAPAAPPPVAPPPAPPPPEREAVVAPPPSPEFLTPRPDTANPPESVPETAHPEGDENALLPPPPPRFPQRVNVTPAPKPAVKPAKPATKPAKSAAKTIPPKTDQKTDAKPPVPKTDAKKSDPDKISIRTLPPPPAPKN